MHNSVLRSASRDHDFAEHSTIRRYYVDSAQAYRQPAVEAYIQEPAETLRVFVVARKPNHHTFTNFVTPFSTSYYDHVNFYGPSDAIGREIFDDQVSSSDEEGPDYFDENIFSPSTTVASRVGTSARKHGVYNGTSAREYASSSARVRRNVAVQSSIGKSLPSVNRGTSPLHKQPSSVASYRRATSRLHTSTSSSIPTRDSIRRRATPGRAYSLHSSNAESQDLVADVGVPDDLGAHVDVSASNFNDVVNGAGDDVGYDDYGYGDDVDVGTDGGETRGEIRDVAAVGDDLDQGLPEPDGIDVYNVDDADDLSNHPVLGEGGGGPGLYSRGQSLNVSGLDEDEDGTSQKQAGGGNNIQLRRTITFDKGTKLAKKPRLARPNFHETIPTNSISPAGKVGNYLTGRISESAVDQLRIGNVTRGALPKIVGRGRGRGRPRKNEASIRLGGIGRPTNLKQHRITTYTGGTGTSFVISNKRKVPLAKDGDITTSGQVGGTGAPKSHALALQKHSRLGRRTSSTTSIPERTSPPPRRPVIDVDADDNLDDDGEDVLALEDGGEVRRRANVQRPLISSASLLNSWYISHASHGRKRGVSGQDLDAYWQRSSRYPYRSRLPPTQHWSSDYVKDGSSVVFLIGVSKDENKVLDQAANASGDVLRIADKEAPSASNSGKDAHEGATSHSHIPALPDASLVLTKSGGKVDLKVIGDENLPKRTAPTSNATQQLQQRKRLRHPLVSRLAQTQRGHKASSTNGTGKRRGRPKGKARKAQDARVDIDAILQSLYNDRERSMAKTNGTGTSTFHRGARAAVEMPTIYDATVTTANNVLVEYSSVAFPKEREWVSHDAVQYQHMHQTNRFRSLNVIIPPLQQMEFENVNSNYICGHVIEAHDATLYGPGSEQALRTRDFFLLPSYQHFSIQNNSQDKEVKLIMTFVNV